MKYSILTVIKNEHDYINQFIEHHLNIGFSFFYIIVDNICYEQEDYLQVIQEKYKKYVKIYLLDKYFDENTCNNIKNNNLNIHDLWINYFNNIILNEVKEDWILAIGLDSYIYLNGENIDTFIKKLDTDIFEVVFPWFCLYNLDNVSNEDFTHNINKFYTTKHDHIYSMAYVKNIEKIFSNSHYFIPKTLTQKIYICDNKYIIKNKYISSHLEIFDHAHFNIFDLNCPKNFSFHVQIRNYDEIILKDFFSWNFINDEKKDSLKKLISNNNFENFRKLSRSLRIGFFLDGKTRYKKINIDNLFIIKEYNNKNTNLYSKKKINELLNDLDIKEEDYNKFIENLSKL